MNRGFYGIPKNRTYQPSIYPYKIYTALLTQTSTNPPIAIILENTIGNLWFTYNNPGDYTINSNTLFTTNKTFIVVGNAITKNPGELVNFINETPSTINLWTLNDGGTQANGVLLNTPMEIRVYN